MAEVRGIEQPAVTSWLVEHVDGAVAPFSFELIAGGRSNLTYKVTGADSRRFVLRRPPMGNVLATAHDMGREYRIISAVGKTSVPVAPALGMCADESVNGAPFYAMGFVDGVVLDSPEAGYAFPEHLRAVAAHSMIDTLADLHDVVPDDIGLGELGRRDGYIERQLKRWSIQWEKSRSRELPLMDELHARLSALRPEQRYTGIVHGDYRLGNALVSRETGRLQAVLDWELCTLGDLLADVGYLLVYWSDPGPNPMRKNDPSGAPGFPSRDELLDRYAFRTGRDLSAIGYYEAFSCWRLACIAEGVRNRYRAGVMADSNDEAEGEDSVLALAQRAIMAIDGM